jgi:hypothetical protein
MTTVDEFARITKRVIARDGFDEYLPTALYPDRNTVVVLEGPPEGTDLESIAVTWAADGAVGDEEFLVAFKIDAATFKVIRRYAGGQETGIFNAVDDA